MTKVADSPFRLICKEFEAGLVFTEMVSADGLVRGRGGHLNFLPEERPIGVQLFGNDPDVMARAAKIAEGYNPDFIDLNFCCPARRAVEAGAGVAILKNPDLLRGITAAVVKAVKIPVTAKIRSGWSKDSIVAVEAAEILDDCGVAAITIHPRTWEDGFKGEADWRLIAEVKKAVSIPVIGNGDVRTAWDAKRMLEETGCDLVMIGRGALGNPWIFREINHLLERGEPPSPPSPREKLMICLNHLDLTHRLQGERGLPVLKKHIGWYLKGLPHNTKLCTEVFQRKSYFEIKGRLMRYLANLPKNDPNNPNPGNCSP